MNLIRTWWRAFLKTWKRQPKQRICANCGRQIKQREQWSAVKWDDKRPRHWICPTADPEKAEAATQGRS